MLKWEDSLYERKTYVDVTLDVAKDGHMYPRVITWGNGRQYQIDQLLDVQPAFASQRGGPDELYLVRIGDQECHLYFERNAETLAGNHGRWFVAGIHK